VRGAVQLTTQLYAYRIYVTQPTAPLLASAVEVRNATAYVVVDVLSIEEKVCRLYIRISVLFG